jgi:hypothetical protein
MRSIKRASPEEFGQSRFRYTRPWGDWRRGCGRYSHQNHGNVEILFTDGVHAIVKCPDGTKSEVHMTNLEPIGQPIARKSGKLVSNSTRGPRTKRPAQLTELDKAAIDDFLADLDMFEANETSPSTNPYPLSPTKHSLPVCFVGFLVPKTTNKTESQTL